MSSIEKPKEATSLSEFATLLGYKPKSLAYILYKTPDQDKYTEFQIPKGNGGQRIIKAPEARLKRLQRRLADILERCFEESCFLSNHRKSLSHGFRHNHSIVTNALNHKNKRYVFNIDLEDFFPSINYGRVYGFFIKNAHFQLDKKTATFIAQIACHNNELPQGSPCSPVISNFIGHLLDIRMVNLARKTKCTYSRYADDLTFSTNNKKFPEEIAVCVGQNNWEPGEILRKKIEKVGFKINVKKTTMQYRTSRQVTTGLIVNKKVNIKKEFYKKTRSMCHELFTKNEVYTESPSDGSSDVSVSPRTLTQLQGKLSFIYQIKRLHDDRKIGARRSNPKAIAKLLREFTFYKYFFSLDRPLILCEGKTDIVYLKCALKQLIGDYPEFIERNEEGYCFKVKFLAFSRSIKDVFSISGGTSGLASIMDIYEQYMKPFKGEGKKHPVIMLIDNDSGAEEIKSRLQNKLKSKLPNEGFAKKSFWFAENLYIVFIPSPNNEEGAAIEDLFEKEILDTKVGGKAFNRGPEIDPRIEYGKVVFGEKVVKVNREKINFDGFRKVFNRLKEVVSDYSGRLAGPSA
jgi:retron-type reverse transcriptase